MAPGTDGLAATAFAPFSRAAVIDTSLAHDCLRWPLGQTPAPPSTDPLPDVPAIIFSGRLDTRTPTENAREFLPLLPHAQLVTVGGTGHDVLDSDITGCAARALGRWADGTPVGTPCRRRSNAVVVAARPARSLSAYRSAPGVGGTRGRVVFATLDTVADAQIAALETLYAGFHDLRGGGLRAGRFTASDNAIRLRLHGYALVDGLRVSGEISAAGDRAHGLLRVDGPGHLDGTLRLHDDASITGTLDGRAVAFHPRSRAATASTRAGRGARTPLAGRALATAVAGAAGRPRAGSWAR